MPWPSGFSPGTLGYMIDRIDMEMMRNGTINDRISIAILDAINIYQKERFRFNETFTTTFQTVVGQQNYTAVADANFPAVSSFQQFYEINWATITVPPAVFDLPRIQPEELLVLTQSGTQMGQPYTFAFMDETLMLYPIPGSGGPGQINQLSGFTPGSGYVSGIYAQVPLAGGSGSGATANINVVGTSVVAFQLINPGARYSVGDLLTVNNADLGGAGSGFTITVIATVDAPLGPFTITIGGQAQYRAPQSNTETGNRWMTDGERLIRSRAKYELALHLTRNMTMAQMMSPEEPARGAVPGAAYAAYRELIVEGQRMARRGIIRPMAF